MKLGSSIRRVREARGLSQRVAAKALGVSQPHICNLEVDRHTPSSKLLDKMFEEWGVDIHVLACLHGGKPGLKRFPRALHGPVRKLRAEWERMG